MDRSGRRSAGPDPVPRTAPLERHRVAPDPTPGLRAPSVPGRQAIVLRDYACAGHCDGRMLLNVENSSGSRVAFRLGILRDDVARQAASADPIVVYARREPPAGYTEAYDKAMVKWQRPGQVRRLYARVDEAGVPAEFVECSPTAPSPGCDFFVTLDGLPQVRLRYTISMEFWDRRDEVREAVERLVRSFLAP